MSIAMDKGFWNISGPYWSMPVTQRWRAELIPLGRNAYEAGLGWGKTEDEAREKAKRRAALRNKTRTLR